MMKSLHRRAQKCHTDERVAKHKAKNCYKCGSPEEARIYAETAVRKRKESQHYQMLNARLSPVLAQLKNEFAGHSNTEDCAELSKLLQEVTAMGKQDNFNVSQNDIDNFIENLDNDQFFENSFQSPTQTHLADLEQRLANLRRPSP